MKKELLKAELDKETPDWLLISNLAKEIYVDNSSTNSFGFKKGVVNLVKCQLHTTFDVYNVLKDLFNSKEYAFCRVGSMGGIDVNRFKKVIPTIKDIEDTYYIVITDKEAVFKNVIKNELLVNPYTASFIEPRYDRKFKKTVGEVSFRMEGENFKIKCPISELKSVLRDNKINELINS